MGRNKSEIFIRKETSYYQAGKKHFDVYVGNEISGIYDKRIPASEKLFNIIKGYIGMDPHMLVAKYNLFGLIGKVVHYVRSFSRTNDTFLVGAAEAIFAIVSDAEEYKGIPIYALFYVTETYDVLDYINYFEKKQEEKKQDGSASDVLWLLGFFRDHAKQIPASKDEIDKLKELVIKYVK